jgi:uncharacterized membrane protein
MALDGTIQLAIIILGLAMLLFWLYVTTIERVFEQLGFSRGEAGTILTLTLLLGVINIPIFPYKGWWVGINVGGALIPLIVCAYLLKSRRVQVAEGLIGVIIVTYITYFMTRAVQNTGIVADFPWAFAPAVAAGFYSLSTFWMDIKKAAPLAYFSGVAGTLIGADVFHLGDILAFPAPVGGANLLSIGGAQVFDLVYLSGIVAVGVDAFVFWLRRQERKHGFERVISEFEMEAQEQPYAKEPAQAPAPKVRPVPSLIPERKGRPQ